jgi:hypothetical protein
MLLMMQQYLPAQMPIGCIGISLIDQVLPDDLPARLFFCQLKILIGPECYDEQTPACIHQPPDVFGKRVLCIVSLCRHKKNVYACKLG